MVTIILFFVAMYIPFWMAIAKEKWDERKVVSLLIAFGAILIFVLIETLTWVVL